MKRVSAVIITRDEESNIGRCIKSVKWANEIIILDSGSVDKTKEIAQDLGAIVYDIEWRGYGHSKRAAVERASGDWILSLDADEEITPELAEEIKNAIENDNFSGFYIPRLTNFLGRWIRHSGWYPDYVLRLFKKDSGNFTEALVHEKVLVGGACSRLRNHMLHYSYPDISTYFKKLDMYSSLSARELLKKGKNFRIASFLIKPIAAFYKHFIFKAGFLDGLEGFLIAILSAFGVITKLIKLRQLEKEIDP